VGVPGRQFAIGREVAPQRLLDLERFRVLTLDAVRVVRIHAAQQCTQSRWHGRASQLQRRTTQIVRLGQQQLLSHIGRHQGLERVNRVVQRNHDCQRKV
jgi:hypothetical protein